MKREKSKTRLLRALKSKCARRVEALRRQNNNGGANSFFPEVGQKVITRAIWPHQVSNHGVGLEFLRKEKPINERIRPINCERLFCQT